MPLAIPFSRTAECYLGSPCDAEGGKGCRKGRKCIFTGRGSEEKHSCVCCVGGQAKVVYQTLNKKMNWYEHWKAMVEP